MGTPLGQGPFLAVVQLICGQPKLTADIDPDYVYQVLSTVLVSPDVGVPFSHLVQLAESVVARNPANASYQELLGAALCRAGRYEAALDRLSEALRLHRNRGTPSLHLFRALALFRLDRSEEARQARNRAMELIARLEAQFGRELQAVSWMERIQLRVLLHEIDAQKRPSHQDKLAK
jgi:tetratricopeptide (TPR) repeat protein